MERTRVLAVGVKYSHMRRLVFAVLSLVGLDPALHLLANEEEELECLVGMRGLPDFDHCEEHMVRRGVVAGAVRPWSWKRW